MAKAYLVPTFHHDIAYLRPESEYTEGCFKILDEALYILEHNSEYCFFVEQAWLLEQYWDARPEKRELMKRFAAEGRFTLEPGLYAVPDMNLPDGESLYMHAVIGRKIAKDTLNYSPRVCMIADCWGHHGSIPQILSSCGYDYYSFSRCMRFNVDKQNFIWQGVDGSTIKCHWMSTHYDGIGFPTSIAQENAEELKFMDAGAEGINALMAKNRVKCGDDPQYLPVGGDMRFPSRIAPEIVKKLNQRDDLPELVFASPAAALDAIPWDKEGTFGGEFESSMQGTFTTNIIIKQLNRKYAAELYSLEALSAVLGKQFDFTDAWKLYLKNQFHDIACGTICNRALSDVLADYRAAGHMLTSIKRAMSSTVGKKSYFNSLPFDRTVLTDEGVLTVPALGFAAADKAVQTPAKTAELPFRFENAFYAAEVGKDGYITSIINKENGKEVVSSAKVPFGAIAMQMDYGDSWWEFGAVGLTRETQAYEFNRPDPLTSNKYSAMLPHVLDAKIEVTPSGAIKVIQKCEIRFWVTVINYETEIVFAESDPVIRYKTSFTNTAKDFRLRAEFGTNGLTTARRQIPYAIVPHGDGLQACQRFALLEDDTARLAVINKGMPSYSVDNDILQLSLFRSVAMEYKCDSSDSYNQGKSFTFEYGVFTGKSDAALWNAALDFNVPVVPMVLNDAVRRFTVTGAQISALRPTENGIFIRVYNPLDTSSTAEITAEGASKAYLTDGLGNITAETGISDGKVTLELAHNKVQGVLLTK